MDTNTKLTEEDLLLLETFSLFDKNGDRSIDTRELIIALRALGRNPTRAEVEAMIRDVDENKNGRMEFEDFKQFVEKGRKQSNMTLRNELKEAFEIFVGDEKQYIHKEDLVRICTKLGQEPLTEDQVNQIMIFADTDGDGKINIDEFINCFVEADKKLCDSLGQKKQHHH